METPNLNYIRELSGGDTAFEKELIGIVKLEFPEERDSYHKSFEIKDYLATAESVHKLKHKISIFGLYNSYQIATNYEDNLKEKNTHLYNEFEAILENIAKYLSHI